MQGEPSPRLYIGRMGRALHYLRCGSNYPGKVSRGAHASLGNGTYMDA